MWQLVIGGLNCRCLANILSFVLQNLTQHIHLQSLYFRNYSQPSIEADIQTIQIKKGRAISNPAFFLLYNLFDVFTQEYPSGLLRVSLQLV